MSFVGTNSSNANNTGTGTDPIPMPAGIATGDDLWCIWGTDNSAGTFSHAAWTSRGRIALTVDGEVFEIFQLTAGVPATPLSNYDFTTPGGLSHLARCSIAFRGRTLGRTFLTGTTNNTNNSSPISMTGTSGTSTAGDDLLLIVGMDKTGTAAVTYSSPSSDLGALTSRVTIESPTPWTSMYMASLDNVSAAAAGNFTCTATGQSGAYALWAISLPASGGGPAFLSSFFGDQQCPIFGP